MRLLEPIQGVKVAQGHFLIHLVFFISMCFIDQKQTYDFNINAKNQKKYSIIDTNSYPSKDKSKTIPSETSLLTSNLTSTNQKEKYLSHHRLLNQSLNISIYLNETESATLENQNLINFDPLVSQSFQNKGQKLDAVKAIDIKQNKKRILGGKTESPLDLEKAEKNEQLNFKLLQWGHLLAFLSQILFFFLKHIEYFNSSQIIQSILVPICYIYFLPFTVFVVRSDFDNWDASNITIIRIWLLIEIMHYFNWLFSIGIFLGSSYVLRFKTISKDLDLLLEDDNVWNDKNTYDFLGVLKPECYYFSYKMSFLITTAQIGFYLPYNLFLYGSINNYPSLLIFILIFVEKFNAFASYTIDMMKGEQYLSNIHSKYTIISQIFKVIVLIAIIVLYSIYNKFNDQNIFQKFWIQTEIISLICEIIWYFAGLLQSYCLKNVEIQKDDQNNSNQVELKRLGKSESFQNEGGSEQQDFKIIQRNEQSIDNQEYKISHKKDYTNLEKTIPNNSDRSNIIEHEIFKKSNQQKNESWFNSSSCSGQNKSHGQKEEENDDDNKNFQEELQQRLEDKSHIHFEEDIFSMTCLCYLKKTTNMYLLLPSKQSQMLYASVITALQQLAMMTTIVYAMMTNEENQYNAYFAHSFALFYVKFPCCVALHFFLYPEVQKGLRIMKFSNNQQDQFVPNGSETSFLIGLIQVMMALIAETLNIIILVYQQSVSHSIMHFVAMEVISRVSNIYFEGIVHTNKLVEVMHYRPRIVHRGEDIKFFQRPKFHQFARMLYVTIRFLFVMVIFYLLPFAIIYLQWIIPSSKEPEGGASSH